ncbi:MAG TPA: DoxX family protein, partial [Planctomycetota bacterium]|nr:DoxX family protein [Planctomycetota bacterium]
QALAVAWFTIIAEIGGGAMVALGVLPRIGALLIALVMAGAIWTVHWENGFFLAGQVTEAGPVPNGYEFNLALLAMALAIISAGGGAFSLLRSKRK